MTEKNNIFLNITLLVCLLIITFLIVKNYKTDEALKLAYKPIETEEIKKVIPELRNIPVFVINMEDRKDRKEHMTNLLNALGFTNYKFVVPVSKEVAAKHPGAENSKLTLAQKSNRLTYNKIFVDNQENTQYDKFIIMEDDIDIYNNKIKMGDVYNSAKNVNWDLLYFEFCFARCYEFEKITDSLYKIPHVLCTGCTMFTRDGAMKLITNFNDRLNSPTDHYFADLSTAGKINSYGYPLFRQNPKFGSDLEGSFKNKFHNIYAPVCLF